MVTNEMRRRKQRRDQGIECTMHAWQKHGKEAEELRAGVEELCVRFTDSGSPMADDLVAMLHRLLDRVDARDSLAYLERQPKKRSATKARKKKVHYAHVRKAR